MGIGKGEELGLNDISTAALADFPQKNGPSVCVKCFEWGSTPSSGAEHAISLG